MHDENCQYKGVLLDQKGDQRRKMRAVNSKVSYLTKKEASDDEVGGRAALGVHWDESRWLSQLHTHILHLALAQHPQHSLQRGKNSNHCVLENIGTFFNSPVKMTRQTTPKQEYRAR